MTSPIKWKLLQVSKDASLAYTRSAILGSEFVLVNVLPHEALSALQSSQFDGVLMCSSIQWHDSHRLIQQISASAPHVRVMRMAEQPEPLVEGITYVSPYDPATLVASVHAGLMPGKRTPGRAAYVKTKATMQK